MSFALYAAFVYLHFRELSSLLMASGGKALEGCMCLGSSCCERLGVILQLQTCLVTLCLKLWLPEPLALLRARLHQSWACAPAAAALVPWLPLPAPGALPGQLEAWGVLAL